MSDESAGKLGVPKLSIAEDREAGPPPVTTEVQNEEKAEPKPSKKASDGVKFLEDEEPDQELKLQPKYENLLEGGVKEATDKGAALEEENVVEQEDTSLSLYIAAVTEEAIDTAVEAKRNSKYNGPVDEKRSSVAPTRLPGVPEAVPNENEESEPTPKSDDGDSNSAKSSESDFDIGGSTNTSATKGSEALLEEKQLSDSPSPRRISDDADAKFLYTTDNKPEAIDATGSELKEPSRRTIEYFLSDEQRQSTNYDDDDDDSPLIPAEETKNDQKVQFQNTAASPQHLLTEDPGDRELTAEEIFDEIKVARTSHPDPVGPTPTQNLRSFIISKTFSSENVVVLLNLRRVPDNGEWVLDKTIAQGLKPETYGGLVSIDEYDFKEPSSPPPPPPKMSAVQVAPPPEPVQCPDPHPNEYDKESAELLKRIENYILSINRKVEDLQNAPPPTCILPPLPAPVCPPPPPPPTCPEPVIFPPPPAPVIEPPPFEPEPEPVRPPPPACSRVADRPPRGELTVLDQFFEVLNALAPVDSMPSVCEEVEENDNDGEDTGFSVTGWMKDLLEDITSFSIFPPTTTFIEKSKSIFDNAETRTSELMKQSEALLDKVQEQKSVLVSKIEKAKSGTVSLQLADFNPNDELERRYRKLMGEEDVELEDIPPSFNDPIFNCLIDAEIDEMIATEFTKLTGTGNGQTSASSYGNSDNGNRFSAPKVLKSGKDGQAPKEKRPSPSFLNANETTEPKRQSKNEAEGKRLAFNSYVDQRKRGSSAATELPAGGGRGSENKGQAYTSQYTALRLTEDTPFGEKGQYFEGKQNSINPYNPGEGKELQNVPASAQERDMPKSTAKQFELDDDEANTDIDDYEIDIESESKMDEFLQKI